MITSGRGSPPASATQDAEPADTGEHSAPPPPEAASAIALPAWLFAVTRHAAANARRVRSRREYHENRMSIMNRAGTAAPAQHNEAHITLVVPPDAEVWFDGDKAQQTGPTREFVSPPLTPGQTYTYHVRVRWTENGKPVEQDRDIRVQAKEKVPTAVLNAAEAMKPHFDKCIDDFGKRLSERREAGTKVGILGLGGHRLSPVKREIELAAAVIKLSGFR